jgi:hypothetical protein
MEISDRRLYEVFERRLLIWGNPKERNRRQILRISKTCVLFAPPCISPKCHVILIIIWLITCIMQAISNKLIALWNVINSVCGILMFPTTNTMTASNNDECVINITQLNMNVTARNHFHNVMDPDLVLLCRNLTSIFGPKRQEVKDGGENLNN